MAIKSKSQLKTDNNNYINTNGENDITGAILNGEHIDFIDSFLDIDQFNYLTSGLTNDNVWEPGTGTAAVQTVGSNSTANANYTTAEGNTCSANGQGSHAEGWFSTANGIASHAEGSQTYTGNDGAHSEGAQTQAIGLASHAEGQNTIANGRTSHAEGSKSSTYVDSEHASANGYYASIGDGQYTRFVRNVVVSDTGIGTETTIETYPMTAARYIIFNIYGGLGIGLSGSLTGKTYGVTSVFNTIASSTGAMFQNIGGVLTKYDGSTSIDMNLNSAQDDQPHNNTTIKINLKDDGSGNVLLYATLYNNNTGLYDITGTANLTIVFETISISTT